MIKSNELRIGNLTKYGDKVCEVSKILRSGFYCTSLEGVDYGNSSQRNYNPIPLTEEWLIKFGFEYRKLTNDHFIKIGFRGNILIVIDQYCYICEPNQKKVFLCNTPQIHKLQKLYFALTGEELILKDK